MHAQAAVHVLSNFALCNMGQAQGTGAFLANCLFSTDSAKTPNRCLKIIQHLKVTCDLAVNEGVLFPGGSRQRAIYAAVTFPSALLQQPLAAAQRAWCTDLAACLASDKVVLCFHG